MNIDDSQDSKGMGRLIICPFIVLNLNISFNFFARLGFNVIWFVKCMKVRKLKIEVISI